MKTTRSVRCSHPGCCESSFYSYASKKEARESTTDFANWKCTRHSNADAVLSVTDTSKTEVLEARPSAGLPKDKLFWKKGNSSGSGFSFGPGFKAWASDFPEGTILTITATITLPEDDDL